MHMMAVKAAKRLLFAFTMGETSVLDDFGHLVISYSEICQTWNDHWNAEEYSMTG